MHIPEAPRPFLFPSLRRHVMTTPLPLPIPLDDHAPSSFPSLRRHVITTSSSLRYRRLRDHGLVETRRCVVGARGDQRRVGVEGGAPHIGAVSEHHLVMRRGWGDDAVMIKR